MSMYRTILLPLDGSELSERAVPYAVALAKRAAARVVIVRAVQTPVSGRQATRDSNRAETQDAKNELQDIASRARAEGVRVEWFIWNDEAGWAILDTAETHHADLIVMSTHGRTGLGRWMYGSVADHVIRMAPAPVLLVPARSRTDWSAAEPFRVLIALDGSALAEEVIEPATELARTMKGEIVLVRAVVPPQYPVGDAAAYLTYAPAAEMASAQEYLTGVAQKLAPQVHASVHVMEGPAHDVIVQAVRDYGVAVTAMGTHGRSGMARVLLGSVAGGVLHEITVPVLLVRPGSASRRSAAVPASFGEHGTVGTPIGVLLTDDELRVTANALEGYLASGTIDESTRKTAGALARRLRQSGFTDEADKALGVDA